MSRILALDTSTDACSVALYRDGELTEDFRVLPREHTRYLLPMVDQLLSEQRQALRELDAIAFGCGPGSFTGLRVCIGVVQGLAFGSGLPVVPVSSLRALAQTALSDADFADGDCILAALDARMDELYWAGYRLENGELQGLGDENLSAPERLMLPGDVSRQRWTGVGNGWRYRERIGCRDRMQRIDEDLLPRASAVATLAAADVASGRTLPAEQALPTYLRDEVAWHVESPVEDRLNNKKE